MLNSAEGKSKRGDEFRKTAKQHDKMYEKYSDKGIDDIAGMYKRMAEIKRDAAKKGDARR